MITRFFSSWWGWALAIVLVVGILSVAPNTHAAPNPELEKLLVNDFQRELVAMYEERLGAQDLTNEDVIKAVNGRITQTSVCAWHAAIVESQVPAKAEIAKTQQQVLIGHYSYVAIALDRLDAVDGQAIIDQYTQTKQTAIDYVSNIYKKASGPDASEEDKQAAYKFIRTCDALVAELEKNDTFARNRINARKAEQEAQQAGAELAELFMPKQSEPEPEIDWDYDGESGYQKFLQCSNYIKQAEHFRARATEENEETRRLNGRFDDARREADHHLKKHKEYAPYTNTQSLIDLAEEHYQKYVKAHRRADEIADESQAQAEYTRELGAEVDAYANKFNTQCKGHSFSDSVLNRACNVPNSKTVDFCGKFEKNQ